MKLESPTTFSADAYPDMPRDFLKSLNQALEQLYNALAQLPDEGEAVGRAFVTNDAGAGFVDLKADFAPVAHVWLTKLTAESGDLTQVFSWTWRATTAGSIRLLFIGLPASTRITINAVYR